MTLFLSTGSASAQATARIPVPSVLGQTRADAASTLKAFGFFAAQVEVPGSGVIGSVYGQAPAAEELAAHGSTVTVYVIVDSSTDDSKLDSISAKLDELRTNVAMAVDTATTRFDALDHSLSSISSRLPSEPEPAIASASKAAGKTN